VTPPSPRILTPTSANIAAAARAIQGGELVAFPTETVYGLGADALNEAAVRNIFALKKRPAANPLIVHVDRIEAIGRVALLEDPRLCHRLEAVQRFWPGPLSVILPRAPRVPAAVSGGLHTVAVRIPRHEVALELLRVSGCPIAAPSANPSQYVSPTTAAHVARNLPEVPIILDGGQCEVGIESTILSLIDEHPTLLRPGLVTAEELMEIFPDLLIPPRSAGQTKLLAPGMMRQHYAPHTPIILRGDRPPATWPAGRTGLITFSASPPDRFDYGAVISLSRDGNMSEIAAGLFGAIRELDERGLELIVVDTCPEAGIGRAIMDRLIRATAQDDPDSADSNAA